MAAKKKRRPRSGALAPPAPANAPDQAWDVSRLSSREVEELLQALHARRVELRGSKSSGRGSEGDRLQPTAEQYRSLYERNLDGVFMVDMAGRFLHANPAGLELFGYSLKELRQHTFMELCAPDRRRETIAAFQEGMAGKPRDLETAMVRPDGRRVELLISATPMVENGVPTGAFGIARDITKRKGAEQALRESEERLRLAAEAAGFGAYDYDPVQGHSVWTSQLRAIHGLAGSRPVGLGRFERMVHPEDREEFGRRVREALDPAGTGCYKLDYRVVRAADGHIRWVSDTGRAIFSGEGQARRVVRVVGIVQDITERREAEQALRASEERLRQSISVARLGHFEHDHLSGEIFCSPIMRAIWGWSAEEIVTLAKTIANIHPEDRAAVVAAVQRGHDPSGDGLFMFEHRVVRPDGSVRWVSARSQTVFEGEGPGRHPVRTVGAVVDISDQKKAERRLRDLNATLEQRVEERTQALRESEERFRSIYEHAATGIVMADWQGRFLQCNPAFCQIIGYSARELRDRKMSSLVHPDDLAQNLELIQQVKSGAISSFSIETRYLDRDNNPVWVNRLVSTLRDEKGQGTHTIALVTDITKRREADAALRHSEEELATFFANAPVGLVWLDPNGRVLRVNRAQSEMLGYSEEKLVGRSITEFDAGEGLSAILPAPHGRGKTAQNHHARLRRKDGSVLHVLVDTSAVVKAGRLVRSDWFIRNISRRVELEQQLLDVAERERQQVGRELHDDLGQILHGLQFLTTDLQLRLDRQGMAEAEELEHVTSHLSEALATTRNLARGLQPVAPMPEGLMAALREQARRAREIYRIGCRFNCRKPVMVPDPKVATHLFRIAQEAVTNAVKHSQCKLIEIQLKVSRGRLVLSIRDDGHGRLPDSEQRSGMGLHVMRFRAKAINGTLTIQRRPTGGMEVLCTVVPPPNLEAHSHGLPSGTGTSPRANRQAALDG